MALHPVGLIKALHIGLEGLLPAHETLGTMTAEYADDEQFAERKRGDYAYIQGRGDRIHLFLCVDDPTELDALDPFTNADGNWRWVVTWEEHEESLSSALSGSAVGLIVATRDGELRRSVDSPPQPGIFIKAYPELRREWRKLASW